MSLKLSAMIEITPTVRAVRLGVGVTVGTIVGVAVKVGVSVSVGVAVWAGVSVGVGVAVWVGVSVGVGVAVWAGVSVGVGVGTELPAWSVKITPSHSPPVGLVLRTQLKLTSWRLHDPPTDPYEL